MFQFPGFAPHLAVGGYVFNIPGCPIRTSVDQFLFADPHSFSQLITSFFASESLGILHTLFLTSIYDLTSSLRIPSPRLTYTYVLVFTFASVQIASYIRSLYSFFSMSMNFLSVF